MDFFFHIENTQNKEGLKHLHKINSHELILFYFLDVQLNSSFCASEKLEGEVKWNSLSQSPQPLKKDSDWIQFNSDLFI